MFGLFRAAGVAAATLLFALTATPAFAAEGDVSSGAQLISDVAAAAAPVEPVSAAPAPAAAIAAPAPRPLRDLVIAFVDYGNQDAEQECLAKAIFFEARSEPLEGQLAVAEVILNRAASGRYPSTICEVVTQPAQFSFIRGGKFPTVDRSISSWRTALAIAEIARKQLADAVAPNVLWYHATYVAPSWGRRLNRVARIGTHIFFS